MPSALATIADEVAEILTDASGVGLLSQDFEAERVYVPNYDSATETALRVQVIAMPQTTTEIAAGDWDAHDYFVEIGIFKKVDQTDTDAIDAMIQFTEEVRSFLRDNAGEIDGAQWMAPEIDGLYSIEELRTKNVFASTQRVTYRSYESTRPNEAFVAEPSLTVPATLNAVVEVATPITGVSISYAGSGDLVFRIHHNGTSTDVQYPPNLLADGATPLDITDSRADLNAALATSDFAMLAGDVQAFTITLSVKREGEAEWADTKTIAVTVVAP